ncbi:hypothetical protein E2C01_033914 [Portunus trituberculatus]|uniref:Uncharacterized protein n=1 Tax=Portunus trituberculatus TaxID=210409 RepID=A0A5B7F5D1_PORTR|nr:hypothetical protein [Portunus trituberculatus]
MGRARGRGDGEEGGERLKDQKQQYNSWRVGSVVSKALCEGRGRPSQDSCTAPLVASPSWVLMTSHPTVHKSYTLPPPTLYCHTPSVRILTSSSDPIVFQAQTMGTTQCREEVVMVAELHRGSTLGLTCGTIAKRHPRG